MHWIERHILKTLTTADSARYRELLPDGIEGNLFQYHARKLERQKLIERRGDGYRLSEYGRTAVGDLHLQAAMTTAPTARACVLVYAERDDGQVLFFRWARHPYRGLVSLPFGRLTHGKTALQMAEEQLYFKSGYRGEYVPLGAVDLLLARDNKTLDHLLLQVFAVHVLTGEHGSDGLTGESFWARPEMIPEEERLAGTHEMLSWINNDRRSPLLEIEAETR